LAGQIDTVPENVSPTLFTSRQSSPWHSGLRNRKTWQEVRRTSTIWSSQGLWRQ